MAYIDEGDTVLGESVMRELRGQIRNCPESVLIFAQSASREKQLFPGIAIIRR